MSATVPAAAALPTGRPTGTPAGPPRPRAWLGTAALVLLGCAPAVAVLQPARPELLEQLPLIGGLVLLLLSGSRRQPLRLVVLWLLLLNLRGLVRDDGRYGGWEISPDDYLLIGAAFAAAYRQSQRHWQLFLGLFALATPLAGLAAWLPQLADQLAGGPAAPLAAGALSINQSAFLFGASLTANGSLLTGALLSGRAATAFPAQEPILQAGGWWPRLSRWLGLGWQLGIWGWLFGSGLSLLLVLATGSRGGLAIAVLATGLPVLVWGWPRLAVWASRLGPVLPWGVVAGVAGLLLVGIQRMYAVSENTISDLNRLLLARCYFSSLFSGHNRLIHGMGFGRTIEYCRPSLLIPSNSHAHNLFAQVAGDSGLFALLFLLAIVAWLMRCGWRLRPRLPEPVILAALSLGLYVLLFLQIEGGWGKQTTLQMLVGLLPAAVTLRPEAPATGPDERRLVSGPPRPPDHGRIRSAR